MKPINAGDRIRVTHVNPDPGTPGHRTLGELGTAIEVSEPAGGAMLAQALGSNWLRPLEEGEEPYFLHIELDDKSLLTAREDGDWVLLSTQVEALPTHTDTAEEAEEITTA